MSQVKQLKAHLDSGQSITPMEALHKFGIFRLAARANDLRSQGMNIITEMVNDDNGKRYARYFKGV